MDYSSVEFHDPHIYFPKLFKPAAQTVPHIDLTSKEAVAAGYSFRKKRHSVKITKYNGNSQMKIIIPYTIDGLPVDEIREHTFEERPFNTLYIHGNIRRIGESAFKESTVKTVIFEDGITSFSEYLFYKCGSLEHIRLPQTLKHIGKRCFMFCKNLKYIEFPKSISDMDYQAFFGCGLEGFGVEAFTPGINNADAFNDTPVFCNNDVVCTYPDASNLTVLHVNGPYAKYGPLLRFRADSVTFCRWSLWSFRIDLSGCKKVRFYRNAVRCERERDCETHGYFVEPSLMILPESEESKQHYVFPPHVTVVNYFPDKNRPYKGPVEINYDDNDDSCIVTPVSDYLPAWSVKEDWDKIRITKPVKIDRSAINSYHLKEIIFEDLYPEDRIFSLFCFALRKVSFRYKGQKYTKYIPPQELATGTVRRIMTFCFTPCIVPSGNGFRHTIYDRSFIDSIFMQRNISSDNNKALAMLRDRERMRWGEGHHKRNVYLKVTNSIKALIAVDILRSDRFVHEPPVGMYLDFLKKHHRYCRQYFRKISGEYPEYLKAFEQLVPGCDSNN